MPAIIFPAFSSGELSDEFAGRIDQEVYYTSLKVARNMTVGPSGSIHNRPGLKYIAPIKNQFQGARLIPFKVRSNDLYILEFGHEYIRFIRDDGLSTLAPLDISGVTLTKNTDLTIVGHGLGVNDWIYVTEVLGTTELNFRYFLVRRVVDANTVRLGQVTDRSSINNSGYGVYASGGKAAKIFEIQSPYAWNDNLLELQYAQTADVMTLTHTLYPVQELKRFGHIDWSIEAFPFTEQISVPGAPVGILDVETRTIEIFEGSSAAIRVRLARQPIGDVAVIATIVDDADDIMVSPISPAGRTYTTTNWEAYQDFNVEAVSDMDQEHADVVVTLTASGAGIGADSIEISVIDTTLVSGSVHPVLRGTSYNVLEGATILIQARLNLQPQHDVTITASTTSAYFSIETKPPGIVFTSDNWDIDQTWEIEGAQVAGTVDVSGVLNFEASGEAEVDTTVVEATIAVLDNDYVIPPPPPPVDQPLGNGGIVSVTVGESGSSWTGIANVTHFKIEKTDYDAAGMVLFSTNFDSGGGTSLSYSTPASVHRIVLRVLPSNSLYTGSWAAGSWERP